MSDIHPLETKISREKGKKESLWGKGPSWPPGYESTGISMQSPQVSVFWTFWHLSSGPFPGSAEVTLDVACFAI